MDHREIQKRVDSIELAMRGKTKTKAVHFTQEAHAVPYVYISHNPKLTDNWHDEEAKFLRLGKGIDTVEALLDAADAFAASLPTKDEAERAAFLGKLSDTIEYGHKIGIEVEFVNPLVEAVKRLSENALTHQPA